jgi:hypothetical protein
MRIIETCINSNKPANRDRVKDKVKELNTIDDYIRFALVIMKLCYLKYSEKKQPDFRDFF